jgi:hypothetical protein
MVGGWDLFEVGLNKVKYLNFDHISVNITLKILFRRNVGIRGGIFMKKPGTVNVNSKLQHGNT